MVYNDLNVSISDVFFKASMLNSDFSTSNASVAAPRQTIQHWLHPPSGRLKVNVDAAWDPSIPRAGVGAVIRDSQGRIIASSYKNILSTGGSIFVEATTFLFGIELVITMQVQDFILEEDALIIVSDLKAKKIALAPYGKCVDSAIHLFQDLVCEVVHTPRINNKLADSLAHLGMNFGASVLFVGHVPNACSHIAIFELSV
ncbi:uncharacterized protein LOC119981841 [Tripterygium wilfordii]|uniref:uncharacterized protein LOC119981841 n=1 Tax=Tripterygium wilfordii TaxID=458696 RepID=UPI0018F8580F|nr:uncharacterized protein LOC119981841 [Tripterygium wilfordii]